MIASISYHPDGVSRYFKNYYNTGVMYFQEEYDTQGIMIASIWFQADGVTRHYKNYYNGYLYFQEEYNTSGTMTASINFREDGVTRERKCYYQESDGALYLIEYYDTNGDLIDSEWFGDSRSNELIDFALTQLGKPYVLGGKGPDYFDCSGFVYYCLNSIGFEIRYMTSTTWRSADFTTIDNMEDIRKGDILCFDGHVGIYMGDGMMVDASSSNGMIVTRSNIFASSYWTNNFMCAKRVF